MLFLSLALSLAPPYSTARQTGFNFVWYGPLQHYWYIALGKWFPMSGANLMANFQPFAIKVGMCNRL